MNYTHSRLIETYRAARCNFLHTWYDRARGYVGSEAGDDASAAYRAGYNAIDGWDVLLSTTSSSAHLDYFDG